MDSSVFSRSFHCYVPMISNAHAVAERTGAVSGYFSKMLVRSPAKRSLSLVSCSKSDDGALSVASEYSGASRATFPRDFEALVLEVCDETEVAELKLKVGDFEMHLKRDIGASKASLPNISPIVAPPIPSKPMEVEAPAASSAPAAPQPPAQKNEPFKNVTFGKSPRLAALEASGSTGYVLVASPSVGSFLRSRTRKGKVLPQVCKEGDMIREGQIIGYLEQFGAQVPVRSDVAGEVLKMLFDVGEAVGYGDPLIAVLPSFHGIEK
ncbi:Biotin carboxyl carrier protein of acetyl-CoA carboxylase [Linum grandiflorum]